MRLTEKQQHILETLREYIDQHKENPTAYRICKVLQNSGTKESVKGVSQVIEALEKKGLVTRDEEHRIYSVENDNYSNLENMLSVPLYGLASCGEALAYAEDNVDGYLQLSKSLFRDKDPATLFAVRALGDSMNKDGINDGDYVIFEKHDQSAEIEGQIVVAVINGCATIKRLKHLGEGAIGLFPHSKNSTHQPIFIHECDTFLIAGILRRVLPAG